MEISTSILNANNRLECTKKLNKTETKYIHIDVMDGIFVPNKQLNTIDELNSISQTSEKKLDIHLMVENPIEYIEKLNNQNIEYITFHVETNQNIEKIISKIKEKNYKVGVCLNPKTELKELAPYLEKIDLILIMSVEPGQGGQEFIPETLNKIKKLSKTIKDNNYSIKIEVDGGIKDFNIKEIKESGANIAVVGSYITKSDNYQEKINNLIQKIKK